MSRGLLVKKQTDESVQNVTMPHMRISSLGPVPFEQLHVQGQMICILMGLRGSGHKTVHLSILLLGCEGFCVNHLYAPHKYLQKIIYMYRCIYIFTLCIQLKFIYIRLERPNVSYRTTVMQLEIILKEQEQGGCLCRGRAARGVQLVCNMPFLQLFFFIQPLLMQRFIAVTLLSPPMYFIGGSL